MPSQFNIRKKLGIRPSSPLRTTSPARLASLSLAGSHPHQQTANRPATPVSAAPNPQLPQATRLNAPILSVPGPQPLAANRSSPSSPTKDAFRQALELHIKSLTPQERKAFSGGNTISAETLLEDVRNFDKTHSETSLSRKCVTRVEGFLTVLNGYLNGVAICIQQNPDISSLVVGGIKFILDLGIRFAAFFNKLTGMIAEIGGHLGYLSKYAATFGGVPEVKEALCVAYGDLLEFCKGARNVFTDKEGNLSRWASFRAMWKTMWIPFELSFDSINSQFHSHVNIVLRIAGIVEVQRLHTKEDLEARKIEDRERGEVLKWLSGLEFDDDHDRIFSKRHGDTGIWLVESRSFKDWIEGQKSCLFWCYGSPGVGKSVLASLVVENVSAKYALNDRIGVAFVYFNYQDQSAQKPVKILSTLIMQLCRQKKDLPDKVKRVYEQSVRDAKFPNLASLQKLFLDLSGTFDQVFLVVDAMDECEERKDHLPYITRLARGSSCAFKIFITSRRERDIELMFTTSDFHNMQIEAKKVDADIATFIRYEIGRRTEEESLCVIGQQLKSKIENALVSRSNGMFLWVQYQLKHIYEQPSAEDIEDALNSLPIDMDATYLRILSKIDKQAPAMRLLAKRALMWVLTAARPLRLRELAAAVAIGPTATPIKGFTKYKAETIIGACGNLIAAEDDLVRPIHYTVKEFLIVAQRDSGDETQTPLQRYQIVPHEAHPEIARSSIQYLLDEMFASINFHEVGNISDLVNSEPLMRYACEYWDFHTRELQALPDYLSNLLESFLFTETTTNLQVAWRIREIFTNQELGCEAHGLAVCLSTGLLHIFLKSHKLDASTIAVEKNKTMVHIAARSGSAANIRVLLNLGAAVDSADTSGARPLYHAVLSGQEAALSVLLEYGADINAQGGSYGNALQAAAYSGSEQLAQVLLDNGADVNAQGGEYGNALCAAAYSGSEQVAQILLDNGADGNAQGGFYGNALQAAAASYSQNKQVAQILLDNGADVNAQGGEYGNALQAAAYSSSEQVAQILLDNGADVNAQGGEYDNALQAASSRGWESVVKMLLGKGADVSAQGGKHGSSLNAATENGHTGVIHLLVEHGARLESS